MRDGGCRAGGCRYAEAPGGCGGGGAGGDAAATPVRRRAGDAQEATAAQGDDDRAVVLGLGQGRDAGVVGTEGSTDTGTPYEQGDCRIGLCWVGIPTYCVVTNGPKPVPPMPRSRAPGGDW